MVGTGQTVQVTLQLPRSMFERVSQAALTEQRQIEDWAAVSRAAQNRATKQAAD